jgi:uncharacterized membrane protein
MGDGTRRVTGRIAYLREYLGTSIWLIPLALCFMSALLALLMLWLDPLLGTSVPGLAVFSLDPGDARRVLGIIAGSIIGVGGVALSVTMVALTLTSGQYGPKVLHSFLEGNSSKLTLGLFLGVYVYALIVLGGYNAVENPRLTVLIALVLAFAALTGFVNLIHRTATDLQADQIVHRIGRQLQRALHSLAEEADPDKRLHDTGLWRRRARTCRSYPVASSRRGYIQTIDYEALLRWCQAKDCLLQVRARAGHFIVDGVCLFKVYARDGSSLENAVDELNASVVVGPMRTPVQDTEYAVTQLNQLAARALSPGINDPGTAMTCIDWFSLALAGIIDRDLAGCVFLDDKQRPRLLARMSDFAGIVKAIYAPLRQMSQADISVTVSLLASLCRLAELTQRPDRLGILALHGKLIHEGMVQLNVPDCDIQDIRQRYSKLNVLARSRLRDT